MNARPHRRAKPSGQRAWIALAFLSGSVGTLLVILSIAILSPRLGLRPEGVAQAIWPRVPMVTESPSAIMRWYHEFDGDAEAQAAAATQYYNHYGVEGNLSCENGPHLHPAYAACVPTCIV
jgi:hypothetical protein